MLGVLREVEKEARKEKKVNYLGKGNPKRTLLLSPRLCFGKLKMATNSSALFPSGGGGLCHFPLSRVGFITALIKYSKSDAA